MQPPQVPPKTGKAGGCKGPRGFALNVPCTSGSPVANALWEPDIYLDPQGKPGQAHSLCLIPDLSIFSWHQMLLQGIGGTPTNQSTAGIGLTAGHGKGHSAPERTVLWPTNSASLQLTLFALQPIPKHTHLNCTFSIPSDTHHLPCK